METDATQSPLHPKTLAELLPDIKGIITESAMRTLTAKKLNRTTAHRTTERVYKPLTMAEMAVEINATANKTLRALPTPSTNMSTRKKAWNSSIKVHTKFVNRNANTNPNLKPMKKILFHQTSDQLAMSFNQSRAISNRNIPKFPEPQSYAKKALAVNRSNDVRISGVYKIPSTPKETGKQLKSIKSSAKKSCSNKENCSKTSAMKPKKKLFVQEDTPLLINSTGYDSFLQHEKDINDIVNKTDALNSEVAKNTRTNSLSASTPFKEYRNVKECFDESSRLETSNIQMADTMINFAELPSSDENKKEDDALVPSLCDILEKITLKSVESADSLEDLVHLKELTLNTLKTLNKIKESEEAKLAKIEQLIALKENLLKKNEVADTVKLETVNSEVNTKKEEVKESNNVQPVIKSCLKPSYKLPRRNSLMKRKILFQHNSSTEETPKKGNVRAQTMYMNLKARLPYLSTPLGKKQNVQVRDTPTIISHKLQEQLDKLYNEKI